MRSNRGFSLIEVVVIIAVLTALAALVVPTLAAMVQGDNERVTREQAERIWLAIYGDPSDGEFGYLGDMGRLPATLTELVEQGTTQTAWHTADSGVDHVGKIGTGWRGPYLRDFFSTSDLLRDAWGNSFAFTNGQITSYGPDGQESAGDNIVYPVHQPATTGTVYFSVLANRIPDPLGATAKLYSVTNGEQVGGTIQKHLTTSTNFDGFIFESVTHGLHVVRVQHTAQVSSTSQCVTVTRYVPVAVYAGQQAVRDLRMTTDADVKVTDNPCTIPD